jgi:hypothetical protein
MMMEKKFEDSKSEIIKYNLVENTSILRQKEANLDSPPPSKPG